ncbi:MAG: GTP 3',8-cyclase MoaA [Planctomycetota bacterium]|nr:GTP 3',8-cyclase MoaA [Planctomycetaceae bacterium]MDQ3332728.1 GTP 3',8-cyclase MoaA [Planctomycetota bacterium]
MPVAAPSAQQLVDRFGRVHTKLRVSVTDRCNLRCFYCMPAENVAFLPKPELLSYEEIERVVRVAASLGVTNIRLTGGEPLVRRDLPALVARLSTIPNLSLGMTTNGILLGDLAQPLYDAGLRSLNVSLDALDPVKFREVTRRDGYERVLAGIEAAQRVGFQSIKINAVAIRGLTEDQLVPFGHFARESGCEARFIEYMPLDADHAWEREKVLFADEIIDALSASIQPLVPLDGDGHSPATEYAFADGVGRIGIIASVSRPFCANCNRFRLTSDGKARACLFSHDETDLRSVLRSDGTDEQLADALLACVAGKWEGHEINTARFLYPDRPMYSIGG